MFKVRTLARGLVLAVAALAVGVLPAQAQLTRGIISGTVADSGGGILPGVTVTLTNQETGVVRATVTNESGVYRAPALDPGIYTVRIELQGFRPSENRDVRVQSGEEVTINANLEVGALEETVQVTADTAATTINKTNATVGIVASGRTVQDLPLSGTRDVTRVALFSPNVVSGPGFEGISANGQRSRNNNFMIDGSDNNDVSVTISTTPLVPEAVSEIAVQTNPYNVEYGRSSGAQVNVITRSGTNSFRGDVFEYYQNSELNARSNVEKRTGFDKPAVYTRNQFGGGIGGPIARNRLFFFTLHQGDLRREEGGPGTTARIPTQAGFAQLANVPLRSAAAGVPAQSAASRQAVLNGMNFLRDIHGQSPVYSNIQNTLVNGVPIETGQINLPIASPRDAYNTVNRVDWSASQSDTVTVRYVMDKNVTTDNVSNRQFGTTFAGSQDILDQNFAASYTKILSPTLLNEFRFSLVRRDLAFPENDPTTPTTGITGNFTIGGLANFPQGRVQNSFQFQNIMSAQRGRHSLKVGTDYRYLALDSLSAFNSKGTFTFNNLQDYMNNFAFQFQQALQVASYDARQHQIFLFAQDDFRVTPNLTLNLGLRYENSTVPLGFFGAEDEQSLNALVPGPTRRDNNNFAPRVGFAYSPTPEGGIMRRIFGDGEGVVRGGFGVGYDVLFYNILTVNASNFPRLVSGQENQIFDVFPNLAPVGGAPVFNPLATFVNTPEDAQHPRVNYWSLAVARELARMWTFEIGYNGSSSRNGINQLQSNPAILTEEQGARVRATQSATSIPSTQLRRVLPQFGSRILIATAARGEYHAGYVSLNKRFARGLQFGTSYTFGATFSDNDESLGVAAIAGPSPQIPQDYFDIDAEWSRSAFDRPHRLVANWIYDIPSFGNWLTRSVLGNWQLNGVFQGQSGQPFTIVTGVDSNGNGGGGDRPNFNPAGSITPDPDTGNFRTFTTEGMFEVPRGTNGLPLANSLGNGNLGRNTLRAPGFFRWDLGVARNFPLFGTHRLMVRADLLNAFNQDSYGVPVNNMNNPNFGTNTNNWGNRLAMLVARYSF